MIALRDVVVDVPVIGEVLGEVAEERDLGLVLWVRMIEAALKPVGDVGSNRPAGRNAREPNSSVTRVLEETGIEATRTPTGDHSALVLDLFRP